MSRRAAGRDVATLKEIWNAAVVLNARGNCCMPRQPGGVLLRTDEGDRVRSGDFR